MTESAPLVHPARSTKVTPAAQQFMRRIVRLGGLGPQAGFRLLISPGGCSGLSSTFTVESEPKPGDRVLEVDTVRLFLPAESCLHLEGVTIDFADTLMQTGLTFLDAKASGGCATSSAPKLVQLTRFHP